MDTDDMLVVTIAIQMHGKVITHDLSLETKSIFKNVRLLCKAGGFIDYESSGLQETLLVGNLRRMFGRTIETSTYDIISQARQGIFTGNVTFDKTLSTTEGSFTDYLFTQGIYLLSVHRGRQLVYPIDQSDEAINFLKIDDLHRLAAFFDSSVPNIEDLSTPFPIQQIYIDEEKSVERNRDLSEDEKKAKIDQIQTQFYNAITKWSLSTDKYGNIQIIKLSALIELVKILIKEPCIINVLDYSCNSSSKYIPASQIRLPIERGVIDERYGGKQSKNNKKMNKRINKRSKRTIRSKRIIRSKRRGKSKRK